MRIILPAFVALFATATAAPAALDPARLATAGDNAPAIQGFADDAAKQFGEPGAQAAAFLIAGMPDADLRQLTRPFLTDNLRLAFKTRAGHPWSRQVPDAMFLDYVLPYAQLDEPRDPWRAEFHERCGRIVKDCKTAGEAVQLINARLFAEIRVKYSTQRKRANQSPRESIDQGLASCTGLSIILANACRSVGIPARLAGTAMWTNKRGNHTWVEVWDGQWHFTGAAEPTADGLNHAWFNADAAKAVADDPLYAIWANCWRKTPHFYPLVWDPNNRSIPAVNVTARYTAGAKNPHPDARALDAAVVHLRVLDENRQRVAARIELLDETGKVLGSVRGNDGTRDMNDMPHFKLKPGTPYHLRVELNGRVREFPLAALTGGDHTLDLAWRDGKQITEGEGIQALRKWLARVGDKELEPIPAIPLTRADAAAATALLWQFWRQREGAARAAELKANAITLNGKSLRLLTKQFGSAPEGQRSLWISMHGGGGAPAQVNDQQWHNQIRLYEPKEGYYIAPRAPTDTWNLWHESHIDGLFDRLIENCVIAAGVDPNKVYLMGYSAGGDGVYQLAPRMADRFAAASMMAGHPNDASPLGLRNLPFAIFSGAQDAAYNRNQVAAEWGAQLDGLAKADPGGYPHALHIYPGLGHWMNRKDAEAVPWMAKFTRNPWPDHIVWRQSGRLHPRFYWLGLPADTARPGMVIRASVANNHITIDAPDVPKVILRLNDPLVDLDQALVVTFNGKQVHNAKVPRQANAILTSLRERADPASAATALLELAAAPK